jgi:uncharacterized protein
MPDATIPSQIGPVGASDRLIALDSLRGFALLGILIVNIFDYAPEATSGADRAVRAAVNVLAEGSFYPLFSFLFGVGFAVFLGRAQGAGRRALPLYLRRVFGLFLIGVAQIVFLEDRNILLRYAVFALPLLVFWKASPRTCLIAAAVFLSLAIGRGAIHRAIVERELADSVRAQAVQEQQSARQATQKLRQAAYRDAAASGSYRDFVVFRAVWQVGNQLRFSVDLRRNASLLLIFSMFLLGLQEIFG